jgi:hypothetical protein
VVTTLHYLLKLIESGKERVDTSHDLAKEKQYAKIGHAEV